MSSITIHPPAQTSTSSTASPLPPLLQTPLGLALIELQGSINFPPPPSIPSSSSSTTVGRLVFPDYGGEGSDAAWTKRAWLYVGEHQRLTGEVKKLAKPLGMLRRRQEPGGAAEEGYGDSMQGLITGENEHTEESTELEIADIIKWKIVFSARPEPVGVAT